MLAYFSLLFTIILSLNSLAANECFLDAESAFSKGESLRTQGYYLLSLQSYAIVTHSSCSENIKSLAQLATAKSLYRLGENDLASDTLKDLLVLSNNNSHISKKVRLLQAWYQPEKQSKLNGDEKKQFEFFTQKSDSLFQEKKLKNIWVSGVSSALIPGLGQAYNGNYQSAALSFIINSLLLATTIELNRNNLDVAALTAGLLFSITYTGNIVGTVESSKTINRNYLEPELENLRREIIPELEL